MRKKRLDTPYTQYSRSNQQDALELRAERTDEDLGIGAIARSSLEGEDVVRSLARCDAYAPIFLLFGCCSRQSAW